MMVVVTALLMGAALRADINVGVDDPQVKDVASGVETLDGSISIAPGGRFLKTGSGTFSVSADKVSGGWTHAVAVGEGGVKVTASADEPATPVLSDAVKAKCVLWVSAKDPEPTHFVTSANGLETWYDVREAASPATASRAYAAAEHTFSANSPTVAEVEGAKMVNFGGVGSKVRMIWKTSAGANVSGGGTTWTVRHMFAVHKAVTSYGCVLGRTDGRASFAHDCVYNPASSMGVSHWWDGEWQDAINARTYRNGVRFDGFREKTAPGLELLELQMPRFANAKANGFFANDSDGAWAGGDYLCEAMIFTVDLTEAERLEVERFLMAKWNVPGERGLGFSVADGASVEYASDTDGTTCLPLSVSGAGDFVKSGTGSLVIKRFGQAEPMSALDLQGGKAELLSPVAVRASAGDCLTVVATDHGPVYERTADAGAGTLLKEGGADIAIDGLPEGTKAIKVQGGSLTISGTRARPVAAFSDWTEVAIPNAGFEECEAGRMAADGTWSFRGNNVPGWTNPSGSYDESFVFKYDSWTGASTWHSKVAPPEGKCALHIRAKNYAAQTTVTIPSPGVYELSFMVYGRDDATTYYGNSADVYLRDPVTGVTNRFGNAIFLEGRYARHVLRTSVETAGEKRLVFWLWNSGNGPIDLDDLHLHRVADLNPSVWQIPGGDFERGQFECGWAKAAASFSQVNTHENWTFTDPSGWSDAKPSVALATQASGGKYGGGAGYWNDSRYPFGGQVELLFRGNGKAVHSGFVPPAGTHRLTAQVAKYGRTPGKVRATVTVGEETIDLGTVSPTGKVMEELAWPTAFTTDGKTTVALELAYEYAASRAAGYEDGAWVDDLALVHGETGGIGPELVSNGTFEAPAGQRVWTGYTNAGCTNKTLDTYVWLGREYGSHPVWGVDPLGGLQFCTLYLTAGIYQDVVFAEPGRYRLSMFAHGRRDTSVWGTIWNAYLPGSARVYLVDTTANSTNDIARFNAAVSNNVEYAVEFDIPAACTRRLGIEGADVRTTTAELMVDGVSLRRIGAAGAVSPVAFDPETDIRVSEGAKLNLDFSGRQKIRTLRLGGTGVRGTVDATTHPEYISGCGGFEVEGRGMMLIFR